MRQTAVGGIFLLRYKGPAVQIEANAGDEITFGKSVIEVLKMKGKIEVVAPGALPKDGLVIEDQRSYD